MKQGYHQVKLYKVHRYKLTFLDPNLKIHIQSQALWPNECPQFLQYVDRNDIFGLKWRYYGTKQDILEYWGTFIFVYYPIISYQRIKVYEVERIDTGKISLTC